MIVYPYWEISRIVIEFEGETVMLLEPTKTNPSMPDGMVSKASIDLSLDQAKKLREELDKAIAEHEHLDKGLEEMAEEEREKGNETSRVDF